MSKKPRALFRAARFKEGFAGDVLKLVSGSTLAQLITIVISPILARLFLPEMFGTAAVFASLIALIKPISCLRYELAIVLPEEDREAANILALSLTIASFVALASALLCFLVGDQILDLFNAPELSSMLWLVPILVFFEGLSLALNYWNTRKRQYGRLSINRVLRSLTASLSKLAFGFAGRSSALALIVGNSSGAILSSVSLAGQTWRDSGGTLRRSVNRSEVKGALVRYRKFPFFSTWSALINTLSWQLPVLMLSASFSSSVVGYYSLGNRLVRMPMMLIGSSIAQVFYQQAATAQKAGRLSQVVRAIFESLVYIGLFPALLLTLTGEELFTLIYGESWATAGVYTEMLSIYMFFNFLASPLSQLISVLEKQEKGLIVNIALLLSRLVTLWIGGRSGNDLFTILLFSISGVFVYAGFSVWIARASGIAMRDYWLILGRASVISLIFLGAGWVPVQLLDLAGLGMLTVYALITVAYYLWLVKSDKRLRALIVREKATDSEMTTD